MGDALGVVAGRAPINFVSVVVLAAQLTRLSKTRTENVEVGDAVHCVLMHGCVSVLDHFMLSHQRLSYSWLIMVDICTRN